MVESIYKLDSASEPRLRERLIYLVSLVTDPHRCRLKDNYWCDLKSQLLDEICGVRTVVVTGKKKRRSCYAGLIVELESAGLFEVNRSYWSKGDAMFTMAYRCPLAWQNERRVLIELPTVDLSRGAQTPERAATSDDPAFAYLAQCYHRDSDLDVRHALRLYCAEHGLSPDLLIGDLGADHYARLSAAAAALPPPERKKAKASKPRGEGEAPRKKRPDITPAMWALEAIWRGWVDGMAWFVRDRFGRVHSPVTSLPEYLRPALRLAGSDRLVSLDLKTSQLVLATSWMVEDGCILDTEDGRRWVEKVTGDDIYEYLYALCHDGVLPTPDERQAFKHELFGHWWYVRTLAQENTEMGLLLAREFPTIDAWILGKKRTGKGREAFKDFPRELQRREAAIFIDDLAIRLRDAGITVLTIHDSLIVRECDADIAEKLMREALSVIKVETRIKREALTA